MANSPVATLYSAQLSCTEGIPQGAVLQLDAGYQKTLNGGASLISGNPWRLFLYNDHLLKCRNRYYRHLSFII